MERRKREKENILNWFTDHKIRDHEVIFRAGSPKTEVLTWGHKNGGSFYRVDYMLRNGSLAVYGDLGSAVYRWGGQIDLSWIAGLDLSYFFGKCEASEDGSRSYDWGGHQNPFRQTEICSSFLNPPFVEQMMGYPTGWTELTDVETPLCLKL